MLPTPDRGKKHVAFTVLQQYIIRYQNIQKQQDYYH